MGSSGEPSCAVTAMSAYLCLRGSQAGPLFIKDRKPITKGMFAMTLKNVLIKTGVETLGFSSHSFCIGAATHKFNQGLSETKIMKRGRSRSNAMLNYIRGIICH